MAGGGPGRGPVPAEDLQPGAAEPDRRLHDAAEADHPILGGNAVNEADLRDGERDASGD